MRLRIVVVAIAIALLFSTMAAQAFGLPQKSPFAADDLGRRLSGGDDRAVTPESQSSDNRFTGLSSIDLLGRLRNLSGPGRLVSSFPEAWLAGGMASASRDKIEYLGFTYVRSGTQAPSGVFYTGEQYGGRHIYVAATGYSPPGMPGTVFLSEGDGYTAYALSDVPPVYAYVRYGAFNVNETVGFGLVNNGGGSLDLSDAAPFEIQRNESDAWRTIFAPMAAQVITPVQNGTAKEWQWDQRLDDGSAAPAGDYRVMIAGRYAAAFRLADDTPAVERSNANYDRSEIAMIPEADAISQAFGKAYLSPSAGTRDDVIGIMQFKARALGLDPAGLRKAIDAAGDGSLPCLAIHARFEGRPAWIVVFSAGTGDSAISGPGVYAVDEASGDVEFKK